MSRSTKRFVPSPSMAVALIALFVALTGSAYASVKLAKNSVTSSAIKKNAVTTAKIKKNAVTTAKIKNRAVTSAKVKNDTLTGKQINEASLTGINAATLAGSAPDAFIASSQRIHFNVPMNRGDAPKTLATFGAFTLTGHCDANGPTNFDYKLEVTSSANGTYYDGNLLTPGSPYNMNSSTNISPTSLSYSSSEPRFLDTNSGLAIFDGDGEPFGLFYGYPDHPCRYVGSFFID